MFGRCWGVVLGRLRRDGLAAIWLTLAMHVMSVGAGFADEFVHDFTRDVIEPGLLQIVPRPGQAAFRQDQAGLHVRLPLAQPRTYQVAIETVFNLKGDFDVATEFTLISADRPSEGWGVGVMLRVVTQSPPLKRGILCRANRPKEGNVFLTSIQSQQLSQEWKRSESTFPTESTTGRLRLVRKGSTIQFWAAPGDNDPWQMLRESEFGPETMRSAAVLVYTGDSPSPVEVRIERLTVTADELGQLKPRRWHEQIWLLWAVFGLTGLLLLVAVALHAVKRRMSTGPNSLGPAQPHEP